MATTPLDIAGGISKKLAKSALVAKVDGEKWDIFRPLERDCKLEIYTFDSEVGKEVRLMTSLLTSLPTSSLSLVSISRHLLFPSFAVDVI